MKKIEWKHPLLEKYHVQLDAENGRGWSARANARLSTKTLDKILIEKYDEWSRKNHCYLDVYGIDAQFESSTASYNCGIVELEADGLDSRSDVLDALDASYALNYGIAVVSLNRAQWRKRTMFLRAGFKIANDWTRNNNSGNDICLLTKDLNV